MSTSIHTTNTILNNFHIIKLLQHNKLWQMLGNRQIVMFISFAMCVIELINLIFSHGLSQLLGTRPRRGNGLIGIIFGSFLHWDLAHLISNLVPLTVLSCMVMGFGTKVFYKFFIYSILIEGLIVWVFGRRNSIVVGASGQIFAMLGFLLTHGVLNKGSTAIGYALLAFLLYGGAVLRIFKTNGENISLAGHVGGFISGVIIAIWFIH